jgi:putative transposase
MTDELRQVIKRMHYPLEVMLVCVRWYAAHPLSLRHIEEMMIECGLFVDHSTVHRWALRILPVLAAMFRRRKRPVGRSWRVDETYVKVSGQWKYLYRAVGRDRDGDTINFLPCEARSRCGARVLRGSHRPARHARKYDPCWRRPNIDPLGVRTISDRRRQRSSTG